MNLLRVSLLIYPREVQDETQKKKKKKKIKENLKGRGNTG
jgi:hypothetical protein